MSALLTRYLLEHLARFTLMVGVAMLAAVMALDGLERASMMAAQHLAPSTAAAYLALRMTTGLHLLAPLVMALAAGLAVGSLRHRGEWDAMRSLGAGPRELHAPFAAAGVTLALALVAFEGFGLPRALERTSSFEASEVMGGPVRLGTGAGPRWWWLTEGVLIAQEVAPAADRLRGVTWLPFGPDGSVQGRIAADEVLFAHDRWIARQGEHRSLGASGEVTALEDATLPLSELSPAGIRRRLLPLAQLDLAWLGRDGRDEARYTLHARLAHPLAGGLLVVLAAMLAAALPRGRALAAAAALGAVALSFLLDLLVSALAPGLGWPPWLPWVTPAALSVASYLTWKYDASARNQPLVQSA